MNSNFDDAHAHKLQRISRVSQMIYERAATARRAKNKFTLGAAAAAKKKCIQQRPTHETNYIWRICWQVDVNDIILINLIQILNYT